MELNTPKRIKTLKTIVCSPGSEYGADLSDCIDANTNNTITGSLNDTNSGGIGMNMGTGSLSPASSCDSPEFSTRQNNANGYSIYAADGRENRRGRPRSEALTTLMIEGSTSPSAIKCTYCNRVFPREKSLQAHLRTHTGMYLLFQYKNVYLYSIISILFDFCTKSKCFKHCAILFGIIKSHFSLIHTHIIDNIINKTYTICRVYVSFLFTIEKKSYWNFDFKIFISIVEICTFLMYKSPTDVLFSKQNMLKLHFSRAFIFVEKRCDFLLGINHCKDT